MKTIIASGRNGVSNDLSFSSSASDLDSLATEIEQLQPDVVPLVLISKKDSDYFTDRSNDESGWEKLLLSQQQQYPTAMIVITDELDSIDLETGLRSGVRGILLQSSTESEILATVEAWYDQALTRVCEDNV